MAEPKISLEQVEHLAKLARLSLSPQDTERLRSEMEVVLAYVTRLGELDVAGVEPTLHPFSRAAALREDRVRESLPQAQALAQAPEQELGAFAVPKLLEEA